MLPYLLLSLITSLQYTTNNAKTLHAQTDHMKHQNKTKVSSDLASCSHGSRQCVFPFIFNNRIITSCTTIDGDTTPWCATGVDREQVMTQWGYCSQECPGVKDIQMFIHPDNAVGSCGEYHTFCQAQLKL